MEATLERKLARISNRQTRYEVLALHPENYRSMLIGYTSRHSLRGLVDIFYQNAAAFIRLVGETRGTRVDGKVVCDNGWIVQISGRTQREAYLSGERPFVGSLDSLDLLA
jgi:hypothetical protein